MTIQWLRAVLVLLAATLTLAPGGLRAAEATSTVKLQAQLIWGTNEEKPADPKLVRLDEKLEKKLQHIFSWKHYWEINHQLLAVSGGVPQRVSMSKQCDIEVACVGESEIELKLFGKGKMVVKKRQKIVRGESIVLAGDDKDQTAWFVVVTPPK